MILLAALLGIFAGGAIALVLRWTVNKVCSEGDPSFAYYFSGAAFAAALAVTPALCMTVRNYGKGLPFGLTEGEMFWYSFPPILLVLSLYPAVGSVSRTRRWNVLVMFLLASVATAGAIFFMRTRAGVNIDDWMILINGTLIIAMGLIQLALAGIHHRMANKAGV